jgi:endonuclease YncB( thermonuclease family)
LIRSAAWLLLLAVLSAADHRGWLLVRPDDDLRRYHGRRIAVTRVLDGDTIEVGLGDRRLGRPATRLRLWGIDCPEAGGPDGAAEAGADAATALTRALTLGRPVLVELEPTRRRDAWGRALAHVILPDGRCLNEVLLAEGLAPRRALAAPSIGELRPRRALGPGRPRPRLNHRSQCE